MKFFNRLFFIALLSMSITQAMEQQPQKEEDYYAILEVPITATEDEIERKYQELYLLFSADEYEKNKEALAQLGYADAQSAEDRLVKIETAYKTLNSPYRRMRYDSMRGYRSMKSPRTALSKARKKIRNALKKDQIDYKKLLDAEAIAHDYLNNNQPGNEDYKPMEDIALATEGMKDTLDGKEYSHELQQKLNEIKQKSQNLINAAMRTGNKKNLIKTMDDIEEYIFRYYAYFYQEARDIEWNYFTYCAKLSSKEGDSEVANNILLFLVDADNNYQKFPNYVSRQNEIKALRREVMINELHFLKKQLQAVQTLLAA